MGGAAEFPRGRAQFFLYCVLLLVVGYARAAAWAVRRGSGGRLWGVAASTLGLLVLGGVLLGYGFAVPSIPRLLLYLLAFSAPAVLLPTLLQWAQRGGPARRRRRCRSPWWGA